MIYGLDKKPKTKNFQNGDQEYPYEKLNPFLMCTEVRPAFFSSLFNLLTMSSFVHTPKTSSGTHDISEWLAFTWDKAHFVGEEIVPTETGPMPLSKAAVVFRNFCPVTGTPGAYFADAVSIVEYRGAMMASLSASSASSTSSTSSFSYPSVMSMITGSGTDVVVPLGTPVVTTSEFNTDDVTAQVLMQAAQNWVTGGKNRGDMRMEHIITLYYGALQSLVFATGTACTKEAQSKWLPAVYGLTRAFAAVCKMYPAALRVSEALVFTHGMNDMLQKALAYVFIGVPIQGATGYDMLATMVRRSLRAGVLFQEIHRLALGPFVVFLLVPLLSGILDGSSSLEDFQTEFNKRGAAFVSDLLEIHEIQKTRALVSDDKRTYQAECLSVLAKAANLPLSKEQSLKLLMHCIVMDASAPVHWSEWGVLPAPPTLSCRISTCRYGIHRAPLHHRDAVTFGSHICSIDDHTFEVFGYKGVEWSGFQFHTPGTYRIHAHDLGIAKAAVGDMHDDELAANWRLTIGRVVLPRDERGYSLSGMYHNGRECYVQSAPLRLDAPFQVVVELDLVRLCQDGNTFVVLERKKKDPLLAFKNVWFHVEFTPPLPPKTTARAVPVTYSGSRTSASSASPC